MLNKNKKPKNVINASWYWEVQNIMKSNPKKLFVIEAFSTTCPACQKTEPWLMKVAQDYISSIVVIKLDANDWNNQEIFQEFGVKALPTFIIW